MLPKNTTSDNLELVHYTTKGEKKNEHLLGYTDRVNQSLDKYKNLLDQFTALSDEMYPFWVMLNTLNMYADLRTLIYCGAFMANDKTPYGYYVHYKNKFDEEKIRAVQYWNTHKKIGYKKSSSYLEAKENAALSTISMHRYNALLFVTSELFIRSIVGPYLRDERYIDNELKKLTTYRDEFDKQLLNNKNKKLNLNSIAKSIEESLASLDDDMTALCRRSNNINKAIDRNVKLCQISSVLLLIYLITYFSFNSNKPQDAFAGEIFLMFYVLLNTIRLAITRPIKNLKNRYTTRKLWFKLEKQLTEQKDILSQIFPDGLLKELNTVQETCLKDSQFILIFNQYSSLKPDSVAYMMKHILQQHGITILGINRNKLTISTLYSQLDAFNLSTYIYEYFDQAIKVRQFKQQLFKLGSVMDSDVRILPGQQDDNVIGITIGLTVSKEFTSIINQSSLTGIFPESKITHSNEIYIIGGYQPANQESFDAIMDKLIGLKRENVKASELIANQNRDRAEYSANEGNNGSRIKKNKANKTLQPKLESKREVIIRENTNKPEAKITWPSGRVYDPNDKNCQVRPIINKYYKGNTFFVAVKPGLFDGLSDAARNKNMEIFTGGRTARSRYGSQGYITPERYKFTASEGKPYQLKIKIKGNNFKGKEYAYSVDENERTEDGKIIYVINQLGRHSRM